MDSLLCRVGGVLGSPVERDRMQADGFSRHLTCDPGGAKGDGCLIQMTRAPESVVWVKQRQVRRRSLKSEPTISETHLFTTQSAELLSLVLKMQ